MASIHHDADWLDGDSVYVYLVAGATENDARTVWCEVLEPSGLDSSNTVVHNAQGTGIWPAPSDCTDQDDVPAFERWV